MAVANGKLSLVGWNRLGGWRLWLTDGDGNSFYYAHLAGYSRWVLKHPNVRAGQVVGFLGRTGDAFTTTPHLHFEIHPHQLLNLGYDGAVDPTAYLEKWRIVTVPKNEMPNPAKLKAPVGTPAQEAAVVWHELLVARHLLPVVSNTALNRPFPPTGLKVRWRTQIHAGAAHIAMSRSDAVPWLGASVFGAVVALLGGAGRSPSAGSAPGTAAATSGAGATASACAGAWACAWACACWLPFGAAGSGSGSGAAAPATGERGSVAAPSSGARPSET